MNVRGTYSKCVWYRYHHWFPVSLNWVHTWCIYDKFRHYAEELLRQQPDSGQAKRLHLAARHKHSVQSAAIESARTQTNLGVAAVGVLAAVAVGALLASRK